MQLSFKGFGRIPIVSGVTALPFPPVSVGGVGDWGNNARQHTSFELELRAAAPVTLTDGIVWGAAGYQVEIASDAIESVTNATDLLTATTHGLTTGDGPIQLTGDDLPTGLVEGLDYYVSVIDADTFKLCLTPADAINVVVVALSDDGSGTMTLLGSLSSDFAEDSLNSYRLCWYKYGSLSPDGSDVLLDVAKGFRPRIDHSPQTVAYAVSATLSSTIAVEINAYAVQTI